MLQSGFHLPHHLNNFLYLVGSNEPQLFSPAYINNELNKENVRQSVEYVNFYNSHDVLSCYICDQDGINNYLKDFHINSDYKPFIEFNTDINEKKTIKKQWFENFIKCVDYLGCRMSLRIVGKSTDVGEDDCDHPCLSAQL